MLVEGRHFLPDVDPEALGHKTLAVNLSDMAAMGAQPRWALLAGALPDGRASAWLAAFARGLFALADRFDVALIGGDTTRGPRNLCVTIVGELPAGTAITRARRAARATTSSCPARSATRRSRSPAMQGRTSLPPTTLRALRARLERPEPRVALGTASARRGVGRARRVRRPHRRPCAHPRCIGCGRYDRPRSRFRRSAALGGHARRRPARPGPRRASSPGATTTSCASPRRQDRRAHVAAARA